MITEDLWALPQDSKYTTAINVQHTSHEPTLNDCSVVFPGPHEFGITQQCSRVWRPSNAHHLVASWPTRLSDGEKVYKKYATCWAFLKPEMRLSFRAQRHQLQWLERVTSNTWYWSICLSGCHPWNRPVLGTDGFGRYTKAKPRDQEKFLCFFEFISPFFFSHFNFFLF